MSDRILRAILPIGIVLLVAWVGWAIAGMMGGFGDDWWSLSAITGLLTSVILIGVGWQIRRELTRRESTDRP
jgi:hypothetical protein